MECMSAFLAALIGSYLVITSAASLTHLQTAKKVAHDFLADLPLLMLSGGISVFLGLILTIGHNIWIRSWPVVITLIGWFLLLQGVYRLFSPDHFTKSFKTLVMSNGRLVFWCWAWLLIGLYLFWMGYFAK